MSLQHLTTADHLFGSRTRARLLRVLFFRPYPRAWVRDLCRRVDTGTSSLRRELDLLTRLGIITMQREGGAAFITPVEEHPFFEPLRQVIAFADDFDSHGRVWRNVWPWLPSGDSGTRIIMRRALPPTRIVHGGRMDPRQVYEAVSAVVDPVYMVGGGVRDALMGRECHDFDFATPLDPERVEQLVRAARRRPYLVGKRFGTVGFSVEGHVIEVTTFRTESYVAGSRKPLVEFLPDLEDDLARRDFTINAMAMHGERVVDPFDGRGDIERRLVRAVGDPVERFTEDPLRMLRAARFAAELDFHVDAPTQAAARLMADQILSVARERWMLELDRLLVGPAATRGLRFLRDTGLLGYLLPEIALQAGVADTGRSRRTLLDRTLAGIDAAPADPTLRWAALMRHAGEGIAALLGHGARGGRLGVEIVERTALYLKWSNRRRDEVMRLVGRDDGPTLEEPAGETGATATTL